MKYLLEITPRLTISLKLTTCSQINNMLTNTLSIEMSHLIIDAVVILFMITSLLYNWRLIEKFRQKIAEAYREHRVHNHKY